MQTWTITRWPAFASLVNLENSVDFWSTLPHISSTTSMMQEVLWTNLQWMENCILAQLQCTKTVLCPTISQSTGSEASSRKYQESELLNVCAVLDAIDNSRSSSPIESFGSQDSHLWEDARPQENLDLKSDERTVEKECFVSSHLKNVSYTSS